MAQVFEVELAYSLSQMKAVWRDISTYPLRGLENTQHLESP